MVFHALKFHRNFYLDFFRKETENIEIDITGEEFVPQKVTEPTLNLLSASTAGILQENSRNDTQLNLNENQPTEVSENNLSRDKKISEIKWIGAKMSDLNLFLSAIGTMFPDS